jgi:D-methionine transport system ATP-binding protein
MGKPILHIRHLSKTFPGVNKNDEPASVLNDVNLTIQEGEIFGVIGRSGAGKSTLVRCINYLERPTSGEIIFDGAKLSELSRKELYRARQSMGMIFQQFNLMQQRTALRNVCYPLEIAGRKKKEARARADELLSLVGMADHKNHYPSQLSGGQKQRVAIARAIALNPKILLCDEATSALDPETTGGVLALLRDINKRFNITIIVITHEMSVIESICSRLAILDETEVVEEGATEEIFANPRTDAARRLLRNVSEL